MEPIRLWRTWGDESYSRPFDTSPSFDYDEEYAALPRADYEALLREKQEAEQRASTLLSVLRGEQGVEIDGEIIHPCAERDAATARAERAEALLGELADNSSKFLRLISKAYEIVMPSFRGFKLVPGRRKRLESVVEKVRSYLESLK